MEKKSFSPLLRVMACCVLILACLALTTSVFAAGPVPAQSAGTPPKIWLGPSQAVQVTFTGSAAARASGALQGTASPQPVTMVQGDFDRDGANDLAVGYSFGGSSFIAIHRGNIDAFAPQSEESFQAIGRGEFPAPFLADAQTLAVPVSPDFIAAGNFAGLGYTDLVVAARGGNVVYVFASDGKGNFTPAQTINLPGGVTSLAAGSLGRSSSNLIIGVAGQQQSFLAVYGTGPQGLSPLAALPLSAPASNILFGDFGDNGNDAAFLSGGKVQILRPSLQLTSVSLPVSGTAMALGSFVFDRNGGSQIALLAADGSVHFAARAEFDPRPFTLDEVHAQWQATGRRGFGSPLNKPSTFPANGWKIVESIPAVGAASVGQAPVFFRTRISDHVADDIMWLNAGNGQMVVVSHPNTDPGATTFFAGQVSVKPYNGSPVAGMPMRTNIDGRAGVVALHAGQLAPSAMMPLPDPTFFVNRNDDPAPGAIASTCNNVSNVDVSSSCSLREAVRKANATAGTDTIMLAAGTFTLSIARNAADHSSALTGALYIQDSVNVVGAGQATTIIQGGSTSTNGVDMVFAVNEDIDSITNATASFSNLTIKFGRNRGSVAGFDGDGGGMEFDTGTGGTANLTLTNVTFDSNATLDGNGGGLGAFNASSGIPAGGPGLVTVNNCIFTNNSVKEAISPATGSGGGIMVFDLMRILITAGTTSFTNNTATGSGAGMMIFSAGSGSRTSNIHGATFTGNIAQIDGGGLWTAANTVVDSDTLIDNNQATGANGLGSGGGIRVNVASPDTVSLSKITVTNNQAKVSGAGIATGNGSGGGGMTIAFTRLAGNTFISAGTGTNLNNDHTTVTATNNWWGTNSPAGTINNSSATTTFDPFIALTHTASPAIIRINQSTTLTGDMSKDNHGVAIGLANLDEIIGLPITFNNAVLGSIPQAQPETLNASAQATATFNAGGTSGTGHADATVDQATVTANIIILEPLRIVKSFSPNPVATNTASTLSFAVTNPNVIAVDANFTDTLPSGLVVFSTPGVTNTCGGTVTAVAGSGSISFSNASLPVGACTITVKVSSATDNIYNNTVTINSTAAGTGALSTSNASLTVINPPSIAKAFGAATIPLNGTTSLTFTISSTNANLTLNGVAFTDNLPSGLVVATPSNLSSTCSGTATATAGSSSASLTGASLAPGASCTVSLNVQGTTAGVKNNSVQVTSTNGGTGNTSNASITVVAPPVIIKAFGAASIPLNGSTSLQFTIQNNNTTVALSGVAFSDTLPAGLIISTPNGLTGTCGGGTITATAGTSVISLSGATLAASSSCTFSVNVTGTAAGLQNNTTGNVTSTEGGTGGTASASVNVVAPPSIAKVFTPSTIALNATTSLTFTITNPGANTVSLTGVAFTDTLPTGLTVANASATICGGTVTTTAPTGISLTGATIAANSQCQFSVTVTGAVSGQYTNTTGAVTSTNGGTGNTATANLTVATPPSITKAFGAPTIPLNGTTTLTFNITNPNAAVTLNGLAFTDNLPAGLVVASPPNVTNTCGGSVTAVAGAGSVSLSGGTVAASASCAVSVSIQGTTAGVKNNSVQVTSTEGGTGNTSNASITVVAPPVIIKAFGAASIPLNGSTSLQFTIQNNNTTAALSGIAFSDTLPAGLIISTPNGLAGSCGGGTITATQGTNVISLSGATLALSSSCTFSINVTGTAAGLQNNTTGNVTSTEGGTGGTASASINVVAPPSIAKVFTPSTIALNATTSLTFTITNPAGNAVSLTGVAFTDTLPTGLTVGNASATICGGTVTTTAPTGISLTGATIAANGQCQFSVTVTGAASGQYTNTTGAVTSTNGGTGNTATANLTVASPPSITKAFGAANIPLNGTTTLTFNITNPNTNVALNGLAFTDNLPAGLVVASTPNLTNSCGGTATAVGGAGSVSLSGGTLAASASCSVSVSIQGTTAGVKNNSVQVTSTEGGTGNTSNASITVTGPPVIIKAFGAASIPLNGSTSLQFTIQNNNTTTSLSGIGFSDTLPAGLIISTPNGLAGSCGGGTITATQGTNVISLSGATLAASSSCTFSINVTGTAAGLQNNTTGNVTSTEGGTGGTASASVNVVAPPSIAKVFNPSTIALNATTSLTFTITNPAANAVALTGVAFSDTLPTGLTVGNASATICGGTVTTTAPTGISLTGATIAVNSQCQFSVTVTGAAAGQYVNTTGNVTSTNGGTGNTATANLTVAQPPTITKAFSASAAGQNTTVFVSFTIVNPNSDPNPNLTLTGVAFSDNLPAGLTVANPNGVSSDCGGTVTAVAGSSTISLTGGAIDPGAPPPPIPGRRGAITRRPSARRSGPFVNSAGFCVVNVNLLVGASATGTLSNTTGPVSANESGPGAPSNTATLEVVQAPTVAKAFGAASVPVNGTTSLTFTFANPNTSTPLVSTALNDTLPGGLVVANPPNVGGTCSADVTANSGSSSIAIANLGQAASSSCTVSVDVTGTTAGTKNNTTGQVSSTFDDGTGTFRPVTGGTASASLAVVLPPSIAKAFNPTTIAPNATSTLTFTITNPAANTVAEAGVAFNDNLPTNLVVATPNGATGNCNGGTLTATAGSGSITLTGGSIPAGSSCVVSVNVTSSVPATYNNTTGAVSSTNGGTGNTASASLKVANAVLSITKTHSGNFPRNSTGNNYTITVSNSATAGPTVGTVTVVDTLPNVANPLVATAISGTGWSCTLATLTCTRSDVLAPGASYPAITLTVTVPQNIQANVTNSVTVSGGGDPSSHTANDPTHIGPPIQVACGSNSATVARGQSATFNCTLDSSTGLGMVTFSASGLPPGALGTFNPASSSQLSDTMTLTITTSGASTSAAPRFPGGPTYALLFPALGLVGLMLAGKKSKKTSKTRLRWVFVLSGLMLLLTLVGCGGRPNFAGTPPGTYNITLNATSSSTSGSTTVTLNVQ